MFESLALAPVTGAESPFEHHSHVFDQCALGAVMDGHPIRKRTRLEGDFVIENDPPQCDGSHKHLILRGHNGRGARTAQAAVYPPAVCDHFLDAIQAQSHKIRSGGRLPEIGCGHFSDLEDQDTTLSKILPELRLLARYRGEKWVKAFDLMVVPWSRSTPSRLRRRSQFAADHICV